MNPDIVFEKNLIILQYVIFKKNLNQLKKWPWNSWKGFRNCNADAFVWSNTFVNPLKQNGLAYPISKDKPISNFRGVEWYFLSPNFNRTFCKQTVKFLIMHCLPLSYKKDAMLIWIIIKQNKNIDIWAPTWDFQQCSMCDQQSLRSACAYAQSDQSLC